MELKKDFTEGYRRPSKTETEQISNYLTKQCKTKMRMDYVLVALFLFCAISMFVSATLEFSTNVVIFAIKIAGTMCLSYYSYVFQTKGRTLQYFLTEVHKGHFYVAPCKGYEANNQSVRIHRGSRFLDDWFEIDEKSIRGFRDNKDYPFKLMKMEYTFKDKTEVYYELFSSDKLS